MKLTNFLPLTLISLLAFPAYGFNLLFLKDAPVAEFDSVDTSLMVENFYDAMNNGEDGVTSEWKNEDTGHFGSATPLTTVVEGNTTCRTVRIESNAKSNSGVSNFKFCKEVGEKWLISENS